jgi:tartrate dehydrogenase/decarboxylase/D-malate dehydrogenase
VHGSAPDIAGKGIANPIATLWSVQLMLDFLGEKKAAEELMKAVETVAVSGFLTADLGGTATTIDFTDRVIAQIEGQ